jgi:hypothetical protein
MERNDERESKEKERRKELEHPSPHIRQTRIIVPTVKRRRRRGTTGAETTPARAVAAVLLLLLLGLKLL